MLQFTTVNKHISYTDAIDEERVMLAAALCHVLRAAVVLYMSPAPQRQPPQAAQVECEMFQGLPMMQQQLQPSLLLNDGMAMPSNTAAVTGPVY